MDKLRTIYFALMLLSFNTAFSEISDFRLKNHVFFLAADSLEGRYTGTKSMEMATNYIVEEFKSYGLKPLDSNFIQLFPMSPAWGKNVIGVLEGSDPKLKDEYIIVSAHYDHLGWREEKGKFEIYNGADDNASGVGGMLEIARVLSEQRDKLKRSIIFIAFDAEEFGLFGSDYFSEHSIVERDKIKFVMNLDMIGMYNMTKEAMFIGCGSLEEGKEYFEQLKQVEGFKVDYLDSDNLWKDRSDTRSFYFEDIPCLHVTTGVHDAYHKPWDDAHLLYYAEMRMLCEQVMIAVIALSGKEEIIFTNTYEFLRSIPGSFIFGINIEHNINGHVYSEGPFIAKQEHGFGAGLTTKYFFTEYFGINSGFGYKYYGTESDLGDIKLSSVDIPLGLIFTSKRMGIAVSILFGGYYNYIIDGTVGDSRIRCTCNDYLRYDYGLEYGFGFEFYNFSLLYKSRIGYTDFFNGTKPEFGEATNQAFIMSIGYYFLP